MYEDCIFDTIKYTNNKADEKKTERNVWQSNTVQNVKHYYTTVLRIDYIKCMTKYKKKKDKEKKEDESNL